LDIPKHHIFGKDRRLRGNQPKNAKNNFLKILLLNLKNKVRGSDKRSLKKYARYLNTMKLCTR